MKRYLLSLLVAAFTLQVKAQLNVPLLHQLVDNSKSENKRQIDVKNEQRNSTAMEESNRGLMQQVKTKYRTLQERFAKMSIVFDAANIGISATPLVREIIKEQQQIVTYAQSDPVLLPVAMDSEIIFVQRANSLVNYLIGLCAVIGDVNQMKVSDRRILFGFIIDELKTISYLSGGVARSLQAAVLKSRGNDPFSDYINREMGVVDQIMNNAKILKQ
ncbi:hypothetical protein HH214_21610 (plasmid) [Mucilaginibacter robiniae]|uniref:Plasmid transfer protein n=1 Tax=Mucilaginibacter robiniae TaxID=2728022 RepID=A0A7L5E840_9SPHI|nr:hypothetical protein [Mucilaginibacter robiniae]QJD98557.1 hypothetical protein HH214_21610 [Mucilaginibacter robiniae]